MSADLSSLRRRARVHAALGDPARLAIVDALRLGDASPGEIAHDSGMPTNLVAHHVKVLADVGLVTRTPSEADRRRTYLRLCPEALAALAPPSTPGLPGTPGLPDRPAVRRVVFVCTHNSARSQLAAALWGRRAPVPAASAGTRPAARVHPRAVAVARRHGLPLDATGTAHVRDVARDGDLLVAVCDSAHESLAGTAPPRLHWSVPDPVRVDTDEAFETAYADLAQRVDRLAPAIVPGGPR